MKSIYRKFKEYIYEEPRGRTVIFGTLNSPECEFHYQDPKDPDGEWKVFKGGRVFKDEYDFLYEYYVAGINPVYKIVDNKIIPYLSITLWKEEPKYE